jgi:NADH-quinone oxidoreductase subunit K
MVPPAAYLVLSLILFSMGAVGVIIRRDPIIIFMCIELMLNAANLAFIVFARLWISIEGQVLVFIIMAVAAAEVAVGLSIIVALFHNRDTANVDEINLMKW